MITARYLGPSNYGVLTYTASFVTLFTSIATLGLNNIIVKEIIDHKDCEGKVLGTSIIMRLFASAISTICIIIIVYLINKNDGNVVYAAFLQSLGLFFQAFDMINYWYQSKLQSKVSTIITLTAYILMTIYKIIILILQKNVLWFAFANTLDYITIAIFLIISYKCRTKDKLSFSFKFAKTMLFSSFPFIIAGIMSALYGQFDKIIIGQMLDNTSVGYYSTAISICGMWTFVLSAIIDSARPIIMDLKNKNQYLYEKRITQLYASIIWISIAVSIIITIFAKPIILILYGSQYLNAIKPLRILTWYTAFSMLGVAINIWLISEHKQKYVNYNCLIGVVTNILLNYTLIPVLGISGAAIAALVTQIVTNFIVPACIKDIRDIAKHILNAFRLKNVISKNTIKTLIKTKKYNQED